LNFIPQLKKKYKIQSQSNGC